MASNEIGFSELRRLVRRDWPLIGGLALALGLAVFVIFALVLPPIFEATAELVVQPTAAATAGGGATPVDFYRTLLDSDSILEKTRKKLVEDGVVDADYLLLLGVNAVSGVVAPAASDLPTPVLLQLTGRGPKPELAASIANTWAQVFIAESGEMVQGTATESEAILGEQLVPTRQELEALSDQRAAQLDDLLKQEQGVATEWDRKIASARKRAADKGAAYQTETRRMMEAEVNRRARQGPLATVRSMLLEIVAVRAQLVQTPRVLDLEKAASDETLSELLVAGRQTEFIDSSLVTQELNPLYDRLAVTVLDLESELKRQFSASEDQLSPALSELERLQLERGVGQVSLNEIGLLEVRILRRGRARNLEDIGRQREVLLAEYSRDEKRLGDLQTKLSERLNEAVISGLLENVELVSIAAPAVPQNVSESRDLALKVAVAVFLGGMLGLMIALFRSVPQASSARV